MSSYEKKGYLTADFKLFHLKDNKVREFSYHYHEFDKIIFFLRGNVQYIIEGKSYMLHPHDIVFVSRSDIHKPEVGAGEPYERMILYIAPQFTQQFSLGGDDLGRCFQLAKTNQTHVMRIPEQKYEELQSLLEKISVSKEEQTFASPVYIQALFLEFLVLLNRSLLNQPVEKRASCGNRKMLQLLAYINNNLFTDLCIDQLAQSFYISKYYLMRQFKRETGYTLHQYITQKRLLASRDLIREDLPLTKLCFDCGFRDYSTFSRAFKTLFHCTPSEYKRQLS